MENDVIGLLRGAFRLGAYEARVYHALLEGAFDPKIIVQRAGIPHPRIYDTMRSLEEKGFARRIGSSYQAVKPKIAFEGRMLQFKREFQEEMASKVKTKDKLLSSLTIRAKDDEHFRNENGDFQILRGINSITNKFAEVLQQSHNTIITLKKAFEATEVFLSYLELSKTFEKKKKKRMRVLAPLNSISRKDMTKIIELGIEVKQRSDILLDLMVSDTFDVLIGVPDPMSEEPYHSIAIWLRNRSFANSLFISLNDVWEKS